MDIVFQSWNPMLFLSSSQPIVVGQLQRITVSSELLSIATKKRSNSRGSAITSTYIHSRKGGEARGIANGQNNQELL